jgi:tRNA A-37 threonylcarbamoyl transferase component Bud32
MKHAILSEPDVSKTANDTKSIERIIGEMCGSEKMEACGWRIEEPFSQGDLLWISISHRQAARRQQGWKIHISAAVPSAESILYSALPILLSEPTHFKVAASLRCLADLNEGRAGLSQVGKFITVYPFDDEQCVRLAMKLDEATRGLRGPAIPSDRALRPGSLVHYRYGSFVEQFITDHEGKLLSVITAPTGDLIEDRRLSAYCEPAGRENPFLIAGIGEMPAPPVLLHGRYLPVAPIHHSVRGALYEAVDVQCSCRCVLKRAYRDAGLDHHLRDARDMLRHEADMLTKLQTILPVPAVYALFEQGDDLWLAMDYVEGILLESYIKTLTQKGERLPLPTLIAWARELACMLDTLHQHAIIYRDLKSGNIILAPDGSLRLIDFGIANDLIASERQFYGGTRGYASPQQRANEPAAITDDIYSFGALLYLLATGAEPAAAPDEMNLCKRPLMEMNPSLPSALCDLITRCLAPRSQDRFASMREVCEALKAASDLPIAIGLHTMEKPLAGEYERYYRYACELSETLRVVVQTAIEGKGPAWAQLKPSPSSKVVFRHLSSGMAGVLLTLAEFVALHDRISHVRDLRAALREGACWLLHSERLAGPLLPGLYSGEAGVGMALLRAGQLLQDQALIAAAEELGGVVQMCPYDLPDLMHGTAGRVKYHLWLWYTTAKDCHLQAAMEAGTALLEQAEESEDGGICWRIPSGHGELSGNVYPGYAHGVAGIGDALLDLYQASGRREFLNAVQRSGSWLMRRALLMGSDGEGLGWERAAGGTLNAAFWCHGSAGIARFLLHAARQKVFPQAIELACRAGKAVVEGTRWAGPSRCHGLAGNIELLLDLHQLTGDQAWLQAALTFAHLLEAYAIRQDGIRLWFSAEAPDAITPGFLLGYAGIAATLLRLGAASRSKDSHLPRIF